MTVVATLLCRDGRRLSDIPIDCPHDPAAANAFVWIGLHEPTAEESHFVQHYFGLHPLAVEDAINTHQMLKVDV